MGNPFKSASLGKRRLKIMVFGPTHTGKTNLALQFPSPAVIDTEDGANAYKDKYKFDVLPVNDANEIMAAIQWLKTAEDHSYRTLVVDPVTLYWEALQQKWAEIFLKRKQTAKGFKFEFYEMAPGDWRHLKGEYKKFIRQCLMLDMNLVFTCHQRDLLSGSSGGSDFMKKVGETFDTEKSTAYFFDTVLQLTREDGKFIAVVHKDRNGMFKVGSKFEWSYKMIAELFGHEDLERQAVVDLATDEQKTKIREFLKAFNTTEEQASESFARYGAEGVNDLGREAAEKIIERFEQAVAKQAELDEKQTEDASGPQDPEGIESTDGTKVVNQ